MTVINSPEELAAAMQLPFTPTPQQWQSISAPLAPTVVIAGAGSGKTALMAMRVVYLVLTEQVRPDQVLGLTFTTKAASELANRIHAALVRAGALESDEQDENGDVLEPTVATYNAYAASLIAEHGLRIGHEPDTRVISDASRFQLAERVLTRHRGAIDQLSDHPATVITNLLQLEGTLNEHLVPIERVREFDRAERVGFERAMAEEAAGKNRKTHLAKLAKAISAIDRRAELLGLVEDYRRYKSQLGLMDFADQISLAAQLAIEQPDVGVLERAKFPVVLLDEYQDTSVSQAQMLSHLFSGPPGAGRGHAVMAVGDPNQAIYGWRGASVSNIINFDASFPAISGEVPVHSLSVNQRSDRRILEAANAVAAPLYAQTQDVRRLDPAAGRAEGRIRVNVFESLADELNWVSEQIQAAHTGDRAWSDIGLLVRDNDTAAKAFDVLSAAEIPVEIVGLSGLIRLPEIAEIVATMELLHDVTANAALLTLLTGPRWAIGPRDLHLLARRARELAGSSRPGDDVSVQELLISIADGIDPTEIPALTDALDDPGDAPYSAAALDRFALLSAELRMLRSLAGEPVLDVVRRIVDVSGIDVELASSINPAAAARRDNLDLFLKAVAEFQAIDGDVTLPSLLAYLTAEDELGNGLDLATPTEADSVKLLTVHRAKGLEWDHVFIVGVCETKFPTGTSRSVWVSSPAVMPAPLRGDAVDQPQLRGYDVAALDAYRVDIRAHEAMEELRLAYVAFTRPEHQLIVTSHLWDPKTKLPRGPSSYQQTLHDLVESWGEPIDGWLERPDPKTTTNPLVATNLARPWPLQEPSREAAVRAETAALIARVGPVGEDPELDVVETATVAQWDEDLERLLAEARVEASSLIEVPLPSSLSVTAMARLRANPEAFLEDLVRPMPQAPSPAARFGTSFHEWVARRFQQTDLFDPSDVLDPSDQEFSTSAELQELIEAFEAGPFAEREPVAMEAPFALVLDGQVIRGRIDAVYAEGDGFLVVDWKTGLRETADPLQLALYRLAWAELAGVPVEQVRACFHYPRSGNTVQADDLPDRDELTRMLRSAQS